MNPEDKTANVGDSAFLPGVSYGDGVIDRIAGPFVYVLFAFRDHEGIERSEYYQFRVYGLTWDDQLQAWLIDPETMH